MIERWSSVVLGLVVPAAALLIGIPLVANTSVHVGGVPLLFAYAFALFPFTTVCLWLAWRIDAPHYAEDLAYEDAATDGEAGA